MPTSPKIDGDRLLQRLDELARFGARSDGGVSRLALTDEDRAARDQVCEWMRALGCEPRIDAIGNIVAVLPGELEGPPVMCGSHIDTVAAGGRYDGNYGVLAGLEVIECLREAGVRPQRPIALGVFTNEEGARFAPDMLGSLVFVGALGLDEALAMRDAQGAVLGDELRRIGYAGEAPVGSFGVHRFLELHIEQGPVLEAEGVCIGAVRDLQGISWQELVISGQANHAGTTPMRLRHDAGFAAGAIASEVRALCGELGGDQLGTVGALELEPNLINVIASRARVTVDLRNTDEAELQRAEALLAQRLERLAEAEGVAIESRRLARFEPVVFDADVHALVRRTAERLGHSVRDMTSGAGHDAQMLARICPAAMIFVPSESGISHNPAEHTSPAELAAGADVLLHAMLELAAD